MGRFKSYYGELKICAIFYTLISPADYGFYQETSGIMAFAHYFLHMFSGTLYLLKLFSGSIFIPYVAWARFDAVFKRNSLRYLHVSDLNRGACTVTTIAYSSVFLPLFRGRVPLVSLFYSISHFRCVTLQLAVNIVISWKQKRNESR